MQFPLMPTWEGHTEWPFCGFYTLGSLSLITASLLAEFTRTLFLLCAGIANWVGFVQILCV